MMNMVNIAGEYLYADSISTGANMLYPIIMNKQSGYRRIMRNGKYILSQEGYAVFTEQDKNNFVHAREIRKIIESNNSNESIDKLPGFPSGALRQRN
jgi:hypothetical protein